MVKHKVGWFVLVVGILFCLPAVADACTCAFGGGAPCQEYWRADAVFSGTVIGSTEVKVPNVSYQWMERKIRVAITEAYRGVEGGQIEISTGLGGGDCGYPFKVNQAYLIYAFRSKEDGKLHASICTRTRPINEIKEDVEFFKSLSGADAGAVIFGQVSKKNYYWKQGDNWNKPVADAELTIEGPGGNREVKSDAEGNFRLSGFAPGTYKVLLKLPPGLLRDSNVKDEGARIVENEVTVVTRGCAQTDFFLESDTRVSGKVTDASGRPVPDLALEMRSANAKPETLNSFLRASTDKEGKFEFKVVPPGDYWFGFRILSTQSLEVPYPRTYYPGAPTRAAAQVITVKEGDDLSGLELLLPAPRQHYEVEGQVVWSDGKPAPDSSVSLTLMEDGELTGTTSIRVDAEGRFKLKVFEGMQYQVSAYPDNARGPEPQSPWVQVPAMHGPGSIKLVLPGTRPLKRN
jgi:5-hydroxyisourate hydrolase-like protein (transthyretin family)